MAYGEFLTALGQMWRLLLDLGGSNMQSCRWWLERLDPFCRRSWNPTLRKVREGWGTRPSPIDVSIVIFFVRKAQNVRPRPFSPISFGWPFLKVMLGANARSAFSRVMPDPVSVTWMLRFWRSKRT